MITDCGGKCGKRIYVRDPDKPIYLCGRCYAAWLNLVFAMVGRGKDAFAVVKPTAESLN